MEHLAIALFTAADLAYLREAVTNGLPSAPRPPTMGDEKDITWRDLRAALIAPPAEVCALLNVPTTRTRAAPRPRASSVEARYNGYAGERYGMLTVIGYGGERRRNASVRHLIEARCDCGKTWLGERYQLVSRRSTSCGCNQYANKQRMR